MAKRRNDGPWRQQCLDRYGNHCRNCGSSKHIEIDHIKPRGQQGRSDVENGLPLCGAWGVCGAHSLKTAGSMLIERDWLEDEQVEYLAAIGWVAWDPVDGSVSGEGWRHFAPVDPGTLNSRPRREDERPIQATDQQHRRAIMPNHDPDDLEFEDDPTDLGDSLAAVATAAMPSGVEQMHLDGMNYAKTKFVGIAYEEPERPALRAEVEYRITGTCVGHAEEVMADGDIRQIAKIKVTSVEKIV